MSGERPSQAHGASYHSCDRCSALVRTDGRTLTPQRFIFVFFGGGLFGSNVGQLFTTGDGVWICALLAAFVFSAITVFSPSRERPAGVSAVGMTGGSVYTRGSREGGDDVE